MDVDVDTAGPLAGVRVLDLTRVLAGPFGTMILADLGADVLKIEEPGSGDGVRGIGPFYRNGLSHYFLAINRNKRSMAVDLKSAAGRALVLDLVEHCDVVIENFRPGVMERLGLSFDELVARRPDVVLCSISGFGRTGPMAQMPSFDLVSQALTGVMSITGEPGDAPTKLGLPMGDLAGGLWGAIAVLAALHRRDRDHTPQHIDLSLLEGLGGLLGYLGQLALLTGHSPDRVGSRHHNVVPYGRFEVKDGHLVVALHVGHFWRRFCRAIERPDLAEDDRFRTSAGRVAHRDVLEPLIEDVLRTRTRAEWQEVLSAADIPHAPVLDVREALEHPQLHERGVLRELHHPEEGELTVYGPVIRFVGDERRTLRPPPLLGEHTREICRTVLGLDDVRIDALEAAGVVRTRVAGEE
ncbi:CaiB/BaiF CoA transferase family protein [Pseudonocardia thermophila]|uniref:CaiB/BaiF CoA transferase family protein n=1 Tax=Pseudonocardia thermophila TaxID=1848 RepID=UPI00248EF47C|nr:CoA transferase [Pseudonocardia thermophila]